MKPMIEVIEVSEMARIYWFHRRARSIVDITETLKTIKSPEGTKYWVSVLEVLKKKAEKSTRRLH